MRIAGKIPSMFARMARSLPLSAPARDRDSVQTQTAAHAVGRNVAAAGLSTAANGGPLSWAAACRWAQAKHADVGFEIVQGAQAEASGSIVYLAQTHNLGDATSQRLAAESQPKILDALLELAPRDVFVEALDRDVDQTQLRHVGLPDLKALFKGYKPGKPLHPMQLRALVLHGAAAVYATCTPDCTLRATSNPALEQETMAAISRRALPPGKVNETREAHLMDVLTSACNAQPQVPSVVIWGAAHDLRTHLRPQGGEQPNFLWINTSGLPMSMVREVQAFFAEQNAL